MSKRASIALAIGYNVAGIFTYAHVYQRVDTTGASVIMAEEERRAIPAIGAGVAWPIYWTTHWAFELTKPEGKA